MEVFSLLEVREASLQLNNVWVTDYTDTTVCMPTPHKEHAVDGMNTEQEASQKINRWDEIRSVKKERIHLKMI